ncbi:hypothetical protein NW94_22980 [Burkholderia mallei]|uniref:N-acetyltransferase domain-containing protein n=3 Tax=Burkholderia mallei TaxID=13373 RepID=A2S1E4_BURM9|nr:GNAT family N-acetyltransferase [Burkholderia mallei]ABM98885.2 conserved hypothetical protein [Burkholderia mallei NCTC 10229]ABO02864.1 conserved hypothetical protein [Burkholderia mallei NCTC 10247]AIW49220.1 hypothetical protein DM57_07870 [Burkholderia mallei]AOP69984.1 GNAT family N-acetyltransferase [Burkholderia mallei]ATD92150.1 hypothetical protein NM78_18515 [Burkholderia mallei]
MRSDAAAHERRRSGAVCVERGSGRRPPLRAHAAAMRGRARQSVRFPMTEEPPMNAFRPPELIETERLRMRPLTEGDAPEAFDALFGDRATTLDLPWPVHRSVDESRASIRRLAEGWRSGAFFSWGLFEKRGGRLIGTLEMHGRLPRVEIGLLTSFAPGRVRTRAWSEMLHRFLGWLIAQPGVYRIEAFCSVTGKAAPLMPHFGFVCEATVRNYEARPNRGMSAGDSYLFAITKAPQALRRAVEDEARAPSRQAA